MMTPVVIFDPQQEISTRPAAPRPNTRFRRPPVVEEDGTLAGVVAQADIAAHAPAQDTGEVVEQILEIGRGRCPASRRTSRTRSSTRRSRTRACRRSARRRSRTRPALQPRRQEVRLGLVAAQLVPGRNDRSEEGRRPQGRARGRQQELTQNDRSPPPAAGSSAPAREDVREQREDALEPRGRIRPLRDTDASTGIGHVVGISVRDRARSALLRAEDRPKRAATRARSRLSRRRVDTMNGPFEESAFPLRKTVERIALARESAVVHVGNELSRLPACAGGRARKGERQG